MNFEDFAFYSEYYIYPWSNFIAEIGGFLGLFLGYAILTLVDLTEILVNHYCGKQSKKEEKLENVEKEDTTPKSPNNKLKNIHGIEIEDVEKTPSPVRKRQARLYLESAIANMSPSRASPAKSSPKRLIPEKMSPKKSSLTPANMSPSRLSPVNMSPSRLSPGKSLINNQKLSPEKLATVKEG